MSAETCKQAARALFTLFKTWQRFNCLPKPPSLASGCSVTAHAYDGKSCVPVVTSYDAVLQY